MKDVLNRIPKYPNRKKITHEDGTIEYVTIEYADEPQEKGTPIDSALFKSIKGDLARIDTYRTPIYSQSSESSGTVKSGTYIGLWGNSHYEKYGMTVSASSEDGENVAYRAMNGVNGYWSPNAVPTVATPATYTIKLDKEIILREFSISGSGNLYCKTFALQGSNDGDNYFDIQSISNNTAELHTYSNNGDTYYKYYRLSITASNSSNLPAILEFNITKWIEKTPYNLLSLEGIPLMAYENNQRLLLDISDDCDNQKTTNILPPMKSTSQDGFFIQSSGDYVNTSVIDAFDYDTENTYWKSLETQVERYIQIAMPINVIPAGIGLKIANISNGKIQGSNNGDEWDDLATGISTSDSTTVEEKEIAITTTQKYRFIRFVFNAKGTGSSLIYYFTIPSSMIGNINYSYKTYVNINELGNKEVSIASIGEAGKYEFVYDSLANTYTAYLNSFSRANVENTFTNAEKIKLAGIEVGAEVNIIDGIKVNGTEVLPDSNRVINISAIPTSEKGAKGGVATLGSDGIVPSSQLPNIEVNIVTSIDQNSTDDEVPSAKCVYNIIGNVETQLSEI